MPSGYSTKEYTWHQSIDLEAHLLKPGAEPLFWPALLSSAAKKAFERRAFLRQLGGLKLNVQSRVLTGAGGGVEFGQPTTLLSAYVQSMRNSSTPPHIFENS